jgi:hypothetical protein
MQVLDRFLPLRVFSALSLDEQSEFRMLFDSFRLPARRRGPREALLSVDLARIQTFVDFRPSNQMNRGFLVGYYAWKSFIASCPIINSAQSERLITILSE